MCARDVCVGADPAPSPTKSSPLLLSPRHRIIRKAALAGVLTADGRPEGFPYRATADGIWAGNSAGGCTNFPSTCEGNPQFFLHVPEACSGEVWA